VNGKVLDFTTRKVRTREAHEGTCHECGYTWAAPQIGACPKCGSDHTEVGNRKHFDYERV